MAAIEEMYKAYGASQKIMCEWTCRDSNICNAECEHYQTRKEVYPPFTAEKQLELIKLVLGIEDSNLYIYKNSRFYVFELSDYDRFALDFERIVVRVESKNFEIGLAKFISKLSDYLDHTKVKEILEG